MAVQLNRHIVLKILKQDVYFLKNCEKKYRKIKKFSLCIVSNSRCTSAFRADGWATEALFGYRDGPHRRNCRYRGPKTLGPELPFSVPLATPPPLSQSQWQIRSVTDTLLLHSSLAATTRSRALSNPPLGQLQLRGDKKGRAIAVSGVGGLLRFI
jgi:hypothetical protein